jgi:IS30 family transposase
MLAALRRQGLNQSQIARQLARHPSTISRELKRNSCVLYASYRPGKAIERSNGRRSRSRRNRRFGRQQLRLVERLLGEQWSPEQIAGHLRKEQLLRISHETIYQHIWRDKQAGGVLYKQLRCATKRRRKRYGAYDSRGRLAGKRHISERPAAANQRSRIGHWEIDTVMGDHASRNCILSLVERKTGFLLIGKLKDRTAEAVTQRAIRLMQNSYAEFESITADNGTEFHGYKTIEANTGTAFFFATPHHSWERGTNENTNGLIRQYLPKGKSMATINQHACNAIAHKLNSRPRKRLGFRTPLESFYAT